MEAAGGRFDEQSVHESDRRLGTAGNKPLQWPLHAVVVADAGEHSFEFIAELLQKVFRYPADVSSVHALMIFQKGRWAVWSGSKEVAELKREQILSAAPEVRATGKVDSPLNVVIEPLPG